MKEDFDKMFDFIKSGPYGWAGIPLLGILLRMMFDDDFRAECEAEIQEIMSIPENERTERFMEICKGKYEKEEMTTIDKIRAEIERRYEENREKARHDDYYRGMNDGLDLFESFLDTLQEQDIEDVKIEWWNKGYIEGRKNAHIPARELGLPKSMDFEQEPEVSEDKRQKEQKPAEWSEEDRDRVAQYLHDRDGGMLWSKATKITSDILDILRHRPSWKPSEEQMKALKRCVDGWTDDGDGALDSLYNDLKKRM